MTQAPLVGSEPPSRATRTLTPAVRLDRSSRPNENRPFQPPRHNISKSPSISQLRAGVIGAGFIGPVHVAALRRLGVQVTALCGSRKAQAVAAKWNIPVAITGHDHRALLERDDVDVVHFASPNRHHQAQALDALRAGKHVVCEKPLAMTARETAEIVHATAPCGGDPDPAGSAGDLGCDAYTAC
jgi:hypothetical protein